MKRFNFRLDKILGYRNYLMKKAQADLANARYECQKREQEIVRVVQKRIEIAQQCRNEGIQGIDVARFQIFKSFMQKLNGDLDQAHIRLQAGKKQVAEKEAALKKASVNKKALVRLKDMQHKKYLEISEREAQKALDEMAIIGRESRI